MNDNKIRIKAELQPPMIPKAWVVRDGWLVNQVTKEATDLESKEQFAVFVGGQEGPSYVSLFVTFAKDRTFSNVTGCTGHLILSNPDGTAEVLSEELKLNPSKMFDECFEEAP
jgi:hypothetical protein